MRVNQVRTEVCAGTLLWMFAASALGSNPSLCLSEPAGCDQPGSTVNVEVLLGAGEPTVVGVQFKLRYDPEALTALDVQPGSACDPSSPFTLAIHERFHHDDGELFFAVGINFLESDGTNQAATVACVRFLPRGVFKSTIDILAGTDVEGTRISDEHGRLVPISNFADCPGSSPETLTSVSAIVLAECTCTEDADCDTLNSDCCAGVCNAQTQLCQIAPINEGQACDDRNDCTQNDRCQAGVCVGSGCTNPSLCFGTSCAPPGSLATVPVLLGEGVPVITGGQFSIQWDTDGLRLVDVQPGVACDADSPFALEVRREGQPEDGELFYAVGVPLGTEGTSGPAALACLYFEILDSGLSEICLFEDINPFLTKLVNDSGQLVSFYNDGDCASERGYPFVHCEHVGTCIIPTASEWGVLVLGLFLLIGAKLRFRVAAA
jgi:hypothetical protein